MTTDRKVSQVLFIVQLMLYKMAISKVAARHSVNFCPEKTDFSHFELPKLPNYRSDTKVVNGLKTCLNEINIL